MMGVAETDSPLKFGLLLFLSLSLWLYAVFVLSKLFGGDQEVEVSLLTGLVRYEDDS